ncbi:MAG: glycerol-3-phosphate acyltransferase [Candidatus Coproplasma sp.]
MFCKTIPALLTRKDICEISDDSNPGAFNCFKHFGKGIGALCLTLDILKGFLPVFLACIFLDKDSGLLSLVMIAPVLGHAVGMFNRFHGGKCIATSFGVMLGILPVTWIGLALLAVLYILFSTLIKINPNRLRSIITFAVYGIACAVILSVLSMFNVAVGCLTIAIIAIVKHIVAKDSQATMEDLENSETQNNAVV